jgi:hypothetical protein
MQVVYVANDSMDEQNQWTGAWLGLKDPAISNWIEFRDGFLFPTGKGSDALALRFDPIRKNIRIYMATGESGDSMTECASDENAIFSANYTLGSPVLLSFFVNMATGEIRGSAEDLRSGKALSIQAQISTGVFKEMNFGRDSAGLLQITGINPAYRGCGWSWLDDFEFKTTGTAK